MTTFIVLHLGQIGFLQLFSLSTDGTYELMGAALLMVNRSILIGLLHCGGLLRSTKGLRRARRSKYNYGVSTGGAIG